MPQKTQRRRSRGPSDAVPDGPQNQIEVLTPNSEERRWAVAISAEADGKRWLRPPKNKSSSQRARSAGFPLPLTESLYRSYFLLSVRAANAYGRLTLLTLSPDIYLAHSGCVRRGAREGNPQK